MKLSSLSKTSLLLFICFGLDKIIAILRQLIIARQFGMSAELDVFNIANNLPDMLFTLISGGALSMALIPVMTDLINKDGRKKAWRLFSSIANLSFLCAFIIALITAIFSRSIVASDIGIAPGFTQAQQEQVVALMRLNLIATLIFSLSGLIMGGLQANRHFLTPALAPILYNFGQIFGALVLAPVTPYQFGPIVLPCFGLGIRGLVYGVILGAMMHLLIQTPALIRKNFRWSPGFNLKDDAVQRVLRVLGPRFLSVFFVQLIFIIRDNLASRLAHGSVTALSYGYMFQQLPETLIGTAIGTAILPSLALFISQKDQKAYTTTIEKAARFSMASSIGIAAIMAIGLQPLIQTALGFDAAQSQLLMWTLRGFLVGLAGHCLLEVANRAFYAQEEALLPLIGAILNVILYIAVGSILFRRLDAPGISLTDSIAFTTQAIFMLVALALPISRRIVLFNGKNRFWRWLSGDETIRAAQLSAGITLLPTLIRSLFGAAISSIICILIMKSPLFGSLYLVKSIMAMGLSFLVYLPFILPEVKILRDF